jgi:hypothetical protein
MSALASTFSAGNHPGDLGGGVFRHPHQLAVDAEPDAHARAIGVDVNVARALADAAQDDGVEDLGGGALFVGDLGNGAVLHRRHRKVRLAAGLGLELGQRRGHARRLTDPDVDRHAEDPLHVGEHRLRRRLLHRHVETTVLDRQRQHAHAREVLQVGLREQIAIDQVGVDFDERQPLLLAEGFEIGALGDRAGIHQVAGRRGVGAAAERTLGRGQLIGVQQPALDEDFFDREGAPALLDRLLDLGARHQAEVDEDAAERLELLELGLDAQRLRQLLGRQCALRDEDLPDRALGVVDPFAAAGHGGRNAGNR